MSNYDPNDNYPREERHLPHEAWHVVQKRSKRRRITMPHAGAEFIGYPSPSHDPNKRFPEWRIEVYQEDWQDEIDPTNNPLHSPGLQGTFEVTVYVKCGGEYQLWKNKDGSSSTQVPCNREGNILVVFYATGESGCAGEYYCVKQEDLTS